MRYRLGAVGAVLVAAALRFHHLPFQPGLNFDEAANGFDILAVLRGEQLPIYFAANRGREPLFIYWQSLFVAALGLSPFSLRLAAAFVGILDVAATYFAGSQLLLLAGRPRWAGRVALLGACFLATGYWPLVLSRIGLRAISLPLFELLAVGFLCRGLRRDRWRDFALAGVCGGLAMYTYLASRLLPVLVGLLALAALAIWPTRRRLAQMAVAAAVWAAVFAPLGAYYLGHADDATSRVAEVSIFSTERGATAPLRALVEALRDNAHALALTTGELPRQAFSGRSAFDPVSGALFWLGLAVAAWRAVRALPGWPKSATDSHQPSPRGRGSLELPLPAREAGRARPGESSAPAPALDDRAQEGAAPTGRPAAWRTGALAVGQAPGRPEPSSALVCMFLVAWLAIMSVPSVLAVDAPHYMRAIGALPALALLMGLGASQVLDLGERLRAPGLGLALVAALLVGSAALNYRDYFVRWLPSETAYYQLMAEKVESARLIGDWASHNRVLLAPLYYQDYTVRLVAREAWSRIQTFDPAAPPVAASQPTLYVFPAIDEEQPRQLVERLGPAAQPQTVLGSNGKPLLRVVRFEPSERRESPPLATLAGSIALAGVRIEPASVAPGATLRVSLDWRALQRLPENYSVFVHLRDASGKTLAQKDGYPGRGRSPTLGWQVGDLVLDEYELAIPTDAPPGEYRVVVGMYRLATLERLALVVGDRRAEGDELAVGTVRVGG